MLDPEYYSFITEYDEARTLAEQRAEGRAEGLAEGEARGIAKGRAEAEEKGRVEGMLCILAVLVKKGLLTLAQAADEAGMTVDEFEAKIKQNA